MDVSLCQLLNNKNCVNKKMITEIKITEKYE